MEGSSGKRIGFFICGYCHNLYIHILHIEDSSTDYSLISLSDLRKMKQRTINVKIYESKAGRMVFARLSEGEDLLEAITLRTRQTEITTGFFILIGALKKAKLGFYREQEYKPVEIIEPVEIVSCMGNISAKEGEPTVHAHILVSNEEGKSYGGHLLPGCVVSVNAELVLIEAADLRLQRVLDEKTKLYLWDA